MQRSVLFALLTVSLLVAAPTQAQKVGGGFRSGSARVLGGNGPRFGSRPGFPNGSFPRHLGYGHFGDYGLGYAPLYYPYWEGEPFEYYPEPTVDVTSPPVLVVQSRDDYRPAAPIPESPKLIEVPQMERAGAMLKPQPPTLFVLKNGDRLETRRYTLAADSLHVEINRQQRTILLDKLDLDATIAVNRERGIDIQVPTDRNQIFLGF